MSLLFCFREKMSDTELQILKPWFLSNKSISSGCCRHKKEPTENFSSFHTTILSRYLCYEWPRLRSHSCGWGHQRALDSLPSRKQGGFRLTSRKGLNYGNNLFTQIIIIVVIIITLLIQILALAVPTASLPGKFPRSEPRHSQGLPWPRFSIIIYLQSNLIMIIITLLILTQVSKHHNHSAHSIHQVDGGGLQGLASTWRSHGIISILLQDEQNLHMMMMALLQGVNLMKQTGLLCFADEPQNPFVTSVLASFEKVKMRLSIINNNI